LVTARSRVALLSKLPATIADGELPTAQSVRVKPNAVTGVVISNRAKFDKPPPGVGLDTVTIAVPATATSAARIEAVNLELLTYVVARALPFQYTVEPLTKPVPFTVKVKPALPGVTAPGTKGRLTNGTAFCPDASAVEPARRSRTPQITTDFRMDFIKVFPQSCVCSNHLLPLVRKQWHIFTAITYELK
jgi:hypothetical protein